MPDPLAIFREAIAREPSAEDLRQAWHDLSNEHAYLRALGRPIPQALCDRLRAARLRYEAALARRPHG